VRLGPDGTSLIILDQTALPDRVEERTLTTVEEIEEAIRSLRVRGAPLIGIAAALGVAAITRRAAAATEDASLPLAERVTDWCRRLSGARPTGANLAWAMARLERAVREREAAPPGELAELVAAEARAIHEEDRAMCRRIGEYALELLPDARPFEILTHCNAGALATGGIGTALAPVYLAHEAGRAVHVFADETRPLLQGSRLTAWELRRSGVEVTVLTDGMAGALMASSRVPDAVLVGADRIAANGDVANKVGTYGLAVLAAHHGVPFYVLAPSTTVDLDTPRGEDIPIELRDPSEVTEGFGRTTAPRDVDVWSPAFDVTPAALVGAIVTERGIHRPPYGDTLREAMLGAGGTTGVTTGEPRGRDP
jgi:methylthioribose-1-phosphate isomerase